MITRARLQGQDFATGKNFSLNQSLTKSFAFSRESYFIKEIENFFPEFAQAGINTRGVGRILDSYAKPLTSSRVYITFSNSPNPSRVYIRLCKHRKRFLLLNSIIRNKKRLLEYCFLAMRRIQLSLTPHTALIF